MNIANITAFKKSDADVLLTVTRNPPENYVGKKFVTDLYIWGSKEYIKKNKSKKLEDLDWLVLVDDSQNMNPEKGLRALVSDPKIVMRSNSISELQDYVEAGMGVSMFNRISISDRSNLERFKPEIYKFEWELWLLYHPDLRDNHKIKTFINFFKRSRVMDRIDKNIDVVILGASGYTGKIVYEYFLDKYKDSSLVFAIAGRNIKKLEDVQSSLNDQGNTKILRIDTDSNEDIENLVKSTKCVLTTVGPYQLYGSKLVEACAKHGTDYVDLCGEPGWMHEMITSHKNLAQSSGARIVFSCGFDSIPFDLGCGFVQQEALKQKGKTSNHVRARVRAMNGQFSGGTIASLGATMAKLKTNPELFAVLANPFSLSEGF